MVRTKRGYASRELELCRGVVKVRLRADDNQTGGDGEERRCNMTVEKKM